MLGVAGFCKILIRIEWITPTFQQSSKLSASTNLQLFAPQ
jgi:hypothetical protein